VAGELEDSHETLGYVIRAENARMTQVMSPLLQTGNFIFKNASQGGESRIKFWELELSGVEFQHLILRPENRHPVEVDPEPAF